MNNLIEKINRSLENYTDYYEMTSYFRRENNKLFNILMTVCSYQLNNQMDGLNNTLLKNIYSKEINNEDIEYLSNLVGKLENNFLKARVYHFLFLKRKKRDRNDIVNAMLYYRLALKNLTNNHDFYEFVHHSFMVLYLGNLVHHHGDDYDYVKNSLIDIFHKVRNEDIHKGIHILHIINHLGIDNKENIISLSQDIADLAILNDEYGQAILALEIAKSNLHPNEVEKISNVNRKIADCYINIARSNNGLTAAHFLLKAIETLRSIKNSREERLRLYEEMRDYQRESLLDLKYCETSPFDIYPLQEDVRNSLRGSQDFFDMLFRLSCCIIDIIKIDTIKEKEISLPPSFIDLFYQQRIYIDHEGIPMSISDIPPTIDFGNISDNDKNTLWSKMVERIKVHHFISCAAIEEALRILNSTYSIEYQYILDLCRNTPFVPQGHEEFFAKGIIAGLNSDFLTATHLLVPQIENSLRHLLKLGAEEPTTLHANNEQERDGLKSLLDNSEIIRIFGIDGVIHLRTILLDNRYPSLRHSIAHGFIGSSHFYGTGSTYLWWLILRIIMIPYRDYWEKRYS